MSASASAEAIWHDVECGGYAVDLAIWDDLASGAPGAVLELGAGTGRVALRLAAAGTDVVALDSSAALLAELEARAVDAGIEVETVHAEVPELDLGRRFAAILAPMQFFHLLGGEARRLALLRAAREHLIAGGTLGAALLAHVELAVAEGPPPLPDVREVEGWVYSSQPLEVVRGAAGGYEIRRLRQAVSPTGELRESAEAIMLDPLTPDALEAEARVAGFEARERIEIAPTEDHVGSTVCVLEAPR